MNKLALKQEDAGFKFFSSFKVNILFFVVFFLGLMASPLTAETTWSSINLEAKSAGIFIHSSNGNRHLFKVELAVNEESQRKGLMNRLSLPAFQGMLFVFPKEQVVKMWMENTLISLDMLFINKEGKIIYIEHNAVPLSKKTLGPDTPVKSVLEIKGGASKELGIKIGDTISVWK